MRSAVAHSCATPRRAAHKGRAKLHAIQKERRQRKREALQSGAAPDWGAAASDSDESEDWDIEKVLGEKVPIPRWAREDAERAAVAGAGAGAEGAATGRGANSNRAGGNTGRETARSGAGGQTARTAGTGGTGRVAQGGGTATVGAGSTRRDSVLSEAVAGR